MKRLLAALAATAFLCPPAAAQEECVTVEMAEARLADGAESIGGRVGAMPLSAEQTQTFIAAGVSAGILIADAMADARTLLVTIMDLDPRGVAIIVFDGAGCALGVAPLPTELFERIASQVKDLPDFRVLKVQPPGVNS